MKAAVDQDRCVGSGQCVLMAPDVFDQRDEDGIVVLRNEFPRSSCTTTCAGRPGCARHCPSH